jgi:Helix-turn-helix domain
MSTLVSEAEKFFTKYVRSGSKDSRKTEVARIRKFLEWVDAKREVPSLDRLGKSQVIGFWREHRGLSETTAHKYWLGISKLWKWLGKPDKPPIPLKPAELPTYTPREKKVDPHFTDLHTFIRAFRESQQLTIGKLANMTGLETSLIEAIESGDSDATMADIQILIRTLGISFHR